MQQMIFIAEFIACSTCFGQYYAHHQELESIIQMVAACGILFPHNILLSYSDMCRWQIVCFLLGNFLASELYMPTLRNTLSIPSSYPPMKMEQSVPKHRHMKFRHRGITQKKAYNIQNTAKVWNQDQVTNSYFPHKKKIVTSFENGCCNQQVASEIEDFGIKRCWTCGKYHNIIWCFSDRAS